MTFERNGKNLNEVKILKLNDFFFLVNLSIENLDYKKYLLENNNFFLK